MSDDMGAVPEGQKQGWGQFLKSIASFSGDLSAMTAPSFILSPTSLVEYPVSGACCAVVSASKRYC